jgi:hypothetical protein
MTRRATEAEISDHDHDLRKVYRGIVKTPFDQRATISKLIGYCEALAASGALEQPMEFELRRRIAETLAVFHMPSKYEQERART